MTSTTRRTVTRFVATIALGLGGIVAFGTAASADPGHGAGGVTDPAIYVDGELYRTVGTPTDFAGTNAPDSSFDTLYQLPDAPSVAEAKPGDRDFNGGRWQVHDVSFDDFDAALTAVDANDSGTFDSAEEVEAAIALGLAHDGGVVKSFLCPVIHVQA